MKVSNLEIILKEICKYESYTFEKIIQERLDKTLKLYIDELEKSSNYILCKDGVNIMKRLSK